MGERLSRNALPIHYDLDFHLRPARADARVRQRIRLAVARPAARIELHAMGLEVKKAVARVGRERLVATVTPKPKRQTVHRR